MNKKQRLTYQIGKRECNQYQQLTGRTYSEKEKARFIRDFQSYHRHRSIEYMRAYNNHYFGGGK